MSPARIDHGPGDGDRADHAVLAAAGAAPAPAHGRRGRPERCEWCGRELPRKDGVGRRRKYCGQACRQRAYEGRSVAGRGAPPADGVLLSAAQWNDLADRLYQMRCAAEDVATALDERASRATLTALVGELLTAARGADRIR